MLNVVPKPVMTFEQKDIFYSMELKLLLQCFYYVYDFILSLVTQFEWPFVVSGE